MTLSDNMTDSDSHLDSDSSDHDANQLMDLYEKLMVSPVGCTLASISVRAAAKRNDQGVDVVDEAKKRGKESTTKTSEGETVGDKDEHGWKASGAGCWD